MFGNKASEIAFLAEMTDYYSTHLSSDRLRRCYEIASPEVKAYLQAEIDHLLSLPESKGLVLELGCGYGRVLQALRSTARLLVGIDTSLSSLVLAQQYSCNVARMTACQLAFASCSFDMVACIQNGAAAFRVDPGLLVAEAVRVTKPGGVAVFSSYSPSFWPHRLSWFREQAREGLLGEIDDRSTSPGYVACKDGFVSGTIDATEFERLAGGYAHSISDNDMSIFCEIRP